MSVKFDNLPSDTEHNILILGESGTGKSTTINALANYLLYPTFEEALAASTFKTLIPTSFALNDPEQDESFIVRQSVKSANECANSDGQSCTQAPMGHVFVAKGKNVRIIDTPGIGDTRGIETDEKNFENILHFLSKHKHLHGICILVRASENRTNAAFKYCITELMTHLHRNACTNVVFCFTFSRDTYFGPGSGFQILKKFIENELKVNLRLNSRASQGPVNCFFIDNEGYRLLLAKQQGYELSDELLEECRKSWEKSAPQMQAMINHVTSLKPHLLEQTTQLNNARKMLIKMAEPMVQMQANISANIERIKVEENRLRNVKTENLQELFNDLTIEVYELEMRELEYPTTVCTAEKCVEVIDGVDGDCDIFYKTRCHEKCELRGVEVNLVGDPILQDCWAMCNGASQNCDRNCGCPWQLHKHIMCEFFKEKKSIPIRRPIGRSENPTRDLELALEDIRGIGDEYKLELKVSQNASSKFAYILSTNSNTPFNQYIEPYLDLLIKEEETKINQRINYPQTTYDSLKKMKIDHRETVRTLREAMEAKSQESVRIEDISKLCDKLKGLKHTGGQFRQMIESNIGSKQRQFEYLDELALEIH